MILHQVTLLLWKCRVQPDQGKAEALHPVQQSPAGQVAERQQCHQPGRVGVGRVCAASDPGGSCRPRQMRHHHRERDHLHPHGAQRQPAGQGTQAPEGQAGYCLPMWYPIADLHVYREGEVKSYLEGGGG